MRYGLIGKTLAHSYSKEIHESLGRYEYDLFSLSSDEMINFVRSGDFGGLNITIPYKKDVSPLCDEVSDLARAIGAVNTLYWKEPDGQGGRGGSDDRDAEKSPDEVKTSGGADAQGAQGNQGAQGGRILVGHNTDYEGFLYAAKRAGITFEGKTVLVLGSGGTSLTVRKAVSDSGAAMIYVASRKPPAGTDETPGCDIRLASYSQLPDIAASVQVIVNTTPVGTYPDNLKSVIELSDFPHCESVIDVIYNPFKTRLLLDAEKAGLRFSNGLPMLVAQATAAAGYFLGTPGAFESENERIIDEMERRMENLVLIGMPGSGKTTVGRILAEQTGKRFVDMDQEIETRAGMSIPDIFERLGEKRFRDMESDASADLGKEHGLVIATGGGAVLRPENVDALRQNGTIIHLIRPVSALSTDGRPLSKDIETLLTMEKARMPIYEAAADITFDNVENCSDAELIPRLSARLKELISATR